MLHPSYVELIDAVNKNEGLGEDAITNSRYSIVCATAKRARQLIDGADPLVETFPNEKPLSVAVEELYDGDLKIITDENATFDDEIFE